MKKNTVVTIVLFAVVIISIGAISFMITPQQATALPDNIACNDKFSSAGSILSKFNQICGQNTEYDVKLVKLYTEDDMQLVEEKLVEQGDDYCLRNLDDETSYYIEFYACTEEEEPEEGSLEFCEQEKERKEQLDYMCVTECKQVEEQHDVCPTIATHEIGEYQVFSKVNTACEDVEGTAKKYVECFFNENPDWDIDEEIDDDHEDEKSINYKEIAIISAIPLIFLIVTGIVYLRRKK